MQCHSLYPNMNHQSIYLNLYSRPLGPVTQPSPSLDRSLGFMKERSCEGEQGSFCWIGIWVGHSFLTTKCLLSHQKLEASGHAEAEMAPDQLGVLREESVPRANPTTSSTIDWLAPR